MVVFSLFHTTGCSLVRSFRPSFLSASGTGFILRGNRFATTGVSTSPHAMSKSSVVKRFDNIIKSIEDLREYRGLVYENGLRVLLVSDPSTDKSAAAMDVAAGHLMDRWEMPGTAHFCEHMLFLGTDKYPSENEYGKFIAANAGSCNAYTSTDHTNYHFDVKPSEFVGALDRFVQFFICPQFTESATDREVNAVHSEHSNNLNNDNWRLMQVERHLAKPGHDYGKFGTGCKKTLVDDAKEKGISTRQELLNFHNQWYSSNIMCLAIVGKESLNELENLVSSCGFDRIENKNVERRYWHDHPRGEEQLRKKIKIVPIKNIRSLKMSFPMPDYTEMYKSDPSHYISHLIGHEGEGSLLSELKRRGWVSALSSYGQAFARWMAVFEVAVDLSEEGIKHTEDIVELVFQYIGLLNQTGPQEWIFKELQDTSACRFRFKDKEHPMSLATDVASNLQRIPMSDILFHRFDLSEYRPDLINDCLKQLVPERLIYRVVGQEFAGQEGNTNEPVYGTEMKVESIPEEDLNRFRVALSNPHPSFHLPHVNDYIPTKFDLKPREAECEHPEIIYDDVFTRVWFKQDDEYKLPKMVTKISITSPVINRCPKSALLTNLYLWCLNDALAEETYAAHISGLRFSLNFASRAFTIKVEGFDEKQPLLVKHLVEKLVNFKPDEVRFQALYDSLKRGLQNYTHAQPYDQSNDYLLRLVSENYWSKEQQLAVCNGITSADVEGLGKDLLKAFHVEVFAHGNTTKEEVRQLAADVTTILRHGDGERPLFQNECSPQREHAVENGSSFLYRHFQETHDVSAVEVVFQVGVQNTAENCRLELLSHLIKEPAYNQLRTNEQLGYIVWSGCRYTAGTLGLQIIVQGPKDPSFVQDRIEAFLTTTRESLVNMTIKEFEHYREGLISRLMEKPKTLGARFRRFWNEIECRQYEFDRKDQEVAAIRDLSKEDIIAFFDKKFASGAPERRKIAIYVYSKSQNSDDLNGGNRSKREVGAGDESSFEEIRSIAEIRQGLALYPRPRPKAKIPPFGVPLTSERAKY